MLAFFIPFLLILFAFFASRITPFGDHTLVISDARAMHISHLSFFSRLLQGKEDILYSFRQGLGKNNIESFGGFFNSVTLLVLFFNPSEYATLYSFMFAFEISLCGLTMYLFLSNAVRKNGMALIFSTCYSLIGFNASYCFLFDFILHVELFPLVAWGILNILRGKKPWLYIISLGWSILTSFYFGYMLCIASVALFATWYLKDLKSYSPNKKTIFRNYILSSIAAGLIPAFIWLPSLSSLEGGRLEQNSLSDLTFTVNMPVRDFLAKLFVGSNNTEQLSNGQPNIFIGSLALFLVIVFFVDRKNSLRNKICYGSVLSFYVLTFFIKAFSMAVQGFSITNWFNYRYSFVFSFILLVIGYLEFCKIWETDYKDLMISGIIYLLIALAVISKKYSFLNAGEVLLSILFLTVIFGAYIWNKKDPVKATRKSVAAVMLVISFFEMYLNFVISYYNISGWELSNSTLVQLISEKEHVITGIKNNDGSFYRIGYEFSLNERSTNDSRLFDYYGVEYFGSNEKLFVFQGIGKLGGSWKSRRIWYGAGEPAAFDSLVGAKYVTARRDLTEEKNYQLLDDTGEDIVYLNPYVLPVAMISEDKIIGVSLGGVGEDPFANQNLIWKVLSGTGDDVFILEKNIGYDIHKSEDPDSTFINYSFTVQKDGPVYAYTGFFVDETEGYPKDAMRYLGYHKKGDTVCDTVYINDTIETDDDVDLYCSKYYVAYADDQALSKHSKILQERSCTLEKLTDSHLTGSLTAASDSRIFFTIPYDEGWTLKIDGVVTKPDKTIDLFMSAPVTEGTHSYELTFVPKNLKNGMLISGGGIITTALLFAFTVYDKKHATKKNAITKTED